MQFLCLYIFTVVIMAAKLVTIFLLMHCSDKLVIKLN